MNVISKKLFSWLMVVAMVLAMVPASPIQVSAAGETTPSTQETTTAAVNAEAEARFDAVVEAVKSLPAVCPLCGAESVTWTALSGSTTETLENGEHVYLTGDVTYTGTAPFMVGGTPGTCLFTNGYNITATQANIIEDTVRVANVVAVGFEGETLKHSTIRGYKNVVKGDGGFTVNLYGGIYEKTDSSSENVIDFGNGILNIYNATVNASTNGRAIQAYKVTVNIYGDTTINGGTVTGNGGTINITNSATLNVYGGTIQGGKAAYGGNIAAAFRAKLTIGADATIDGGEATKGGNIAFNTNGYDQGYISTCGEITGGKAQYGGNIIIEGAEAPLNVNGGEISGGEATSWGGNIRATNITVTAGTISDGSANNGGNIYANAGGELNVSGGTISGGTASKGGSIYNAGGAAIISGSALVDGGTATSGGGAIFSQGGSVTVSGGTIQNGNATGGDGGGNICIYDGPITIGANATITGGTASAAGGNIYANGATCVITTSGKITDGEAKGGDGGNIIIHGGSLTVNDGEISGGSATRWGGNIRSANITINGGLIYGGTAGDTKASNNIMCYNGSKLTIAGGVIVGDTYLNSTATQLTLSGSPKIVTSYTLANSTAVYANNGTGLSIPNGLTADISGLSTDAKIAVTANEGQVITMADPNAADLADCFTSTTPGLGVRANTSNALYVVALPAAIVDKNGNTEQYTSNEEALADYDIASGKYIRLSGAAEISEDVILIPSGDVVLSGEGKVQLIDPANKDFHTSSGTVAITEKVELVSLDNTVDGDRYITLLNGNKLSAHYIEMALTHVTLRTGSTGEKGPGVYYKASYKCDEALRDRVALYGVAVSLIDMPGDDFLTDNETSRTALAKEEFLAAYKDNSVAVSAGSIFNILNTGNSKEKNAAQAQLKIYANVYMAIDPDGKENPADTLYVMGEPKENWDYKQGTAYSLFDVLKGIDSNWNENYYTSAQKTTVENFIKTWKNYITDDAYTTLEGLLTNIL